MRQLLPLEPWNNVNVHVEDFLSRGVPVLLDDGDAVGFRRCFHGDRKALDEFVDVGDEVVGYVIDSFVMHFWDDECVTFVERSNVEERKRFVVLVEDAGGSFISDDFAEDTVSGVRLDGVSSIVILTYAS